MSHSSKSFPARFRTLTAATLIAAGGAAIAQTAAAPAATPASPTSSPAKKELVARALQAQQAGLEAMSRAMLQQPVGNLMQGAGQALQQLPQDKREATAKAIEADIKKFVDETTPLMRERALKLAPSTVGAILEERFSEDELKQLVTWLESPVNKKFNQIGPEMQRALAEKLVGDTRSTIETRLKALEQSIVAKLNAARPAPAAAR
ncbi:DUF2059 domain-containing protein [Roseateles sp. DAIF2]|uniref:DUF2059 domain-containing protein n=1 Tax=Roseateles sp. DAIF2 TaxID=2714952 RepID=UPI0035301CD0